MILNFFSKKTWSGAGIRSRGMWRNVNNFMQGFRLNLHNAYSGTNL